MYSLSDVTGLTENFVERRVFVYLCDSTLFPTIFVRLADKLSNVRPSVVKNVVCQITVRNVTWNVRHSLFI